MKDIDLGSLERAERRLLTQQAGRIAFEIGYAARVVKEQGVAQECLCLPVSFLALCGVSERTRRLS